MLIPTHQVHNVLTAYARRLHNRRSDGSDGNGAASDAFDQRRRGLIQRMTICYIDKIIRGHADQSLQTPLYRNPAADDQLFYHQIDAVDGKTSHCLNHRPGSPPDNSAPATGGETLSTDMGTAPASGPAAPLLPDGLHPGIK